MTKPGDSRLPYGLRHPIKAYENRKWSSDTRRQEAVRGRLPSVALEDIDEEARAAEREAAHRQNDRLKYAVNDAEAHEKYLKTRSDDPFRDDIEPALLNSGHIAEYVAETGMIFPFKPGNLKSASYEMPLKGPYVFIDKDGNRQEGVLEDDDDELVIPSNSITFLTVEPFFRLPDYIALRHNLKIDHIYKGALHS